MTLEDRLYAEMERADRNAAAVDAAERRIDELTHELKNAENAARFALRQQRPRDDQ